MLWGKIVKLIPFLFQVLLVVAAVLLFAFFDPFGIIITTKRTLKDTPVDVRSIRDIGQLITAEYYGEVISSYAHELQENQDTAKEVFRENTIDMLERYVLEINRLHDQLEARRFKRNKIEERAKEPFANPFFQKEEFRQLLYYIDSKDRKANYKVNDLDNELTEWKTEKLVRQAVIDGYNEGTAIRNTDSFLANYFKFKDQVLEKEKVKGIRKKNLVLLGRGWVKAGFDFGTFTERNFNYDSKRKIIYFIGFQPQILSATINPWFIPERGVEGFEFLIVDRKAKRDYKEVQIVKQRCLDELIRKAHEREILKLAMENGSESLKEFFSLILDENIEQVVLYDNELAYTYAEIVKNDSISGEELLLIDFMLQKAKIEGIDEKNTTTAKEMFVESMLQSEALVYLQSEPAGIKWSPNLAIRYAVCKDGVFNESSDSIVISTMTAQYCALDSIENFHFNCDSLVESQFGKGVNIYLSNRTQLEKGIVELGIKNIDTLYNDDNTMRGYLFGRMENEESFDRVIGAKVRSACNCGE
ncbi:MAG: hypothetical protein U5K79_10095 [Cyclobacteriaceae bacterium]|nr:hypothetical protein [Cyclobacteriaceae bacterium]